MYSYGPPHMAVQKQDDQHEHTFSSYVRIRDVVLKTCLGRWTIGRSGERGSGISVLPARHDDDIYIYIYKHLKTDKIINILKWLSGVGWLKQIHLKSSNSVICIDDNKCNTASVTFIYKLLALNFLLDERESGDRLTLVPYWISLISPFKQQRIHSFSWVWYSLKECRVKAFFSYPVVCYHALIISLSLSIYKIQTHTVLICLTAHFFLLMQFLFGFYLKSCIKWSGLFFLGPNIKKQSF